MNISGLVLLKIRKPATPKGKMHSSQYPLCQHGDVYKRISISAISAMNVPGMAEKRNWGKYFNKRNSQCFMI